MKTKTFLFILLVLAISCTREEVFINSVNEAPDAPSFNFMAGTYHYDIGLTISSQTEDAVIYYTLDGTRPSVKSLVYTSPIVIEDNGSSVYVRAISKSKQGIQSPITESYYKIDYSYTSGSYNSQLALPEFQDKMVGKWIGYRSSPWTSKINVEVTFKKDGTYLSRSLTPEHVVFYYGTDQEVNSYRIYDLNTNGLATGYLGRFNDSNTDDIRLVQFSEDLNVLSFEFWHRKTYGPLKYVLTRIE